MLAATLKYISQHGQNIKIFMLAATLKYISQHGQNIKGRKTKEPKKIKLIK